MRPISLSIAATAGVATMMLAGVGPAAAAPNDDASCLGKVFQAQAVEAPGTVANRIAQIREEFLNGAPFGQVLLPLAQSKTCP